MVDVLEDSYTYTHINAYIYIYEFKIDELLIKLSELKFVGSNPIFGYL